MGCMPASMDAPGPPANTNACCMVAGNTLPPHQLPAVDRMCCCCCCCWLLLVRLSVSFLQENSVLWLGLRGSYSSSESPFLFRLPRLLPPPLLVGAAPAPTLALAAINALVYIPSS
jgi:hypothetical protein